MTTRIAQRTLVHCSSAQAARRLGDFFRAHGGPDGDVARVPLWIDATILGLPTPLHLERNVVVTMQSIGGPVDEIGAKVGAALVGTFLGILMAYGFFAPMAGRMEALGEQEMVFFRAVAVAVVAINEGASPKDVVMRARQIIAP